MLNVAELFDIGDILRVLRLRAGIRGPKEIKKKLGVNKGTMSRIENTSKLKRETLENLAPRLGTSVAEIYAARDALRALKPAPSLPVSLCKDNLPSHAKLHTYLETVLHDPTVGPFLAGNVVTFHSQVTGEPPDFAAASGEGNDLPKGVPPNRRPRKL